MQQQQNCWYIGLPNNIVLNLFPRAHKTVLLQAFKKRKH